MSSVRLTEIQEADLRAEMAECKARVAEIDEVLMHDKYGDSPLVLEIRASARRRRALATAAATVAKDLHDRDERFSKPVSGSGLPAWDAITKEIFG